jgi:putative nucleotidyltransferase with HDIG domain
MAKAQRSRTDERAAVRPARAATNDAAVEPARTDDVSLSADPVLADLAQTESHYRELRARWEQQAADLAEARAESEREREHSTQLAAQLETSEVRLEQERRKAERERERGRHAAAMLKDIHRSLFDGNVHGLILKTCLTLTGATRGLYVTALDQGRRLQVRAAVDMEGYPNRRPSPFIEALCQKAVAEHQTFVCNELDGEQDLPKPESAAEEFHNCLVAPVVLLKNFDGIIIAADKMNGEFEEHDIDTLLSVGDQAAVAVLNVRLERELQNAYLSTVSMLADAVEAKDSYTHGHCEMVSRYARLTSDRLGLTELDRSVVCYAALLHDVGKIGVSDGVLHKPGPLLPEERDLMRSHVRVGHDLIKGVPALRPVADVVLHHHEWFDGTGYPDGLRGDDIPIASRIVAVVDAYCAMIARRSYKEAYTDEHARDELVRFSGTQFDPKVVEAFLAVLESPNSADADADFDAECGLLPTFVKQQLGLGTASASGGVTS